MENKQVEVHAALLTACERGRVDIIRKVYQEEDYGNSQHYLLRKISNSNLKLNDTLLKRGIDFDQVDVVRALLLYDSISFQVQLNQAVTLEDNIYQYSRKEPKMERIFHEMVIQCIANDHVERFSQFMALGISINHIDESKENNSFLHWMVLCSAHGILAVALQMEHVDVNVQNEYGATPLHEAVHLKNIASAKLLVQYHADRDTIRGKKGHSHGCTAVELARKSKCQEMIQLVVEGNIVSPQSYHHKLQQKDLEIAELKKHIAEFVQDQSSTTPQDIESPTVVQYLTKLKQENKQLVSNVQESAVFIQQLQNQLAFTETQVQEREHVISMLQEERRKQHTPPTCAISPKPNPAPISTFNEDGLWHNMWLLLWPFESSTSPSSEDVFTV